MVTSARYLVFMANDIAMNITSKIVALSSAVAFALQIALALLMLRYFSPEEVGTFSVISQIGFFWTTLALAQSPLRLLANHGASVFDDARQAWLSSLQRFVWLLPVAALAVWWGGLSFFNALLWALLLSLCQLTWMLAQSMRLRMLDSWSHVAVRVLPPLVALLVASGAIRLEWNGPSLLLAGLLGYAVGAAWFFPALSRTQQIAGLVTSWREPLLDSLARILHDPPNQTTPVTQGDDRSSKLRMAHTLVDAMLATLIVLVWQRLYGAQETGWMSAPLRVMGFLPAVIHMAWAQVNLAQPQHARASAILVGLSGLVSVAAVGASCAFALEMRWLGEQWQGVWLYLFPLALWQGSACMVAAYSHRPFETQHARVYSWICIGVASLQALVLLAPVVFYIPLTSFHHISWLALVSASSLIALCLWLKQLK